MLVPSAPALPSLALPSLALPSLALAADTSAVPAEAIVAVSDWASSHGPLGVGAFAAVHTLAVVLCFPATILFEVAAGYALGAYQGAALAWTAKVTAAFITFAASSGMARTALSSAGVEAAAERAFAAQPSLARLAENIEQDGARYTLLARLSPIPSWLNNYGLAFAGVCFADYAPATALATLPAVLSHAYAGSLLSSLRTLAEGGAVPSTLAGSALGGLSVLGGGFLLRELAAAVAAPDEEEARLDPAKPSPRLPSRAARADPPSMCARGGEEPQPIAAAFATLAAGLRACVLVACLLGCAPETTGKGAAALAALPPDASGTWAVMETRGGQTCTATLMLQPTRAPQSVAETLRGAARYQGVCVDSADGSWVVQEGSGGEGVSGSRLAWRLEYEKSTVYFAVDLVESPRDGALGGRGDVYAAPRADPRALAKVGNVEARRVSSEWDLRNPVVARRVTDKALPAAQSPLYAR